MGLSQSISFPTSIFLSVLRSVFSLDLSPNGTTPVFFNNPQLKRISTGKSPTRDASIETITLEVSRKLENNFQERYRWLTENRDARKNVSLTDVIVPARSCVAVVQQTMTEEIGRKSRNIETDAILPLDSSFSSPINNQNNNNNNNPWFVSQWYNSVNGNSYGITIDTKNSDVMLSLETFSKESSCGIGEKSESLAEMKFGLENGEEMSLKFNKWDPNTLEMLSKAMLKSTGYTPTVKSRQDKKEIYSFVYIDRLGRNICCSLDINNTNVLKKLKMMEEWALQSADPCDLFDVKINSSTTFQLDLKNPTTIRNLKSLKEESITGVTKKLINPVKRKERMMAKSLSGYTQTKTIVNKTEPITVELFSPYTGTFTAIFDLYHHQTMITLQNFTKEFQKSLYEYNLKLNTDLDETFEIKLDMANPKVVYELVKMTRKYSNDVVNFNPKLILNNLITIFAPEDETYLTVDISKSLVYGGLFDLSNRDKKGVELTIPCAGVLNNIYVDVFNPSVINKIKSFSLATIDLTKTTNPVKKVNSALIFLNIPDYGFQPICLDLSDRKVIAQLCDLIRNHPKGEHPAYLEIIDDTGQFLTISLDLNNPDIVQGLSRITKKAWFIGIDAAKSPHFTICFLSECRYRSVKMRLKPDTIDEMAQIFDKYRPNYTILKIFDSRKRCNIIFIDPTIPNLFVKLSDVTDSVEILKPTQENALTFYNPSNNLFNDLDLSSSKTREILNDFEAVYNQSKPLTIIKHYHLDKEDFFFVNIDQRFLDEMRNIRADFGLHIITEKIETIKKSEDDLKLDPESSIQFDTAIDGHFMDANLEISDSEKIEWIS